MFMPHIFIVYSKKFASFYHPRNIGNPSKKFSLIIAR